MIEKFNIKYLQSFNKELNEILYYIENKLKNKNTAKRLSIKIEKAILEASKNPKSFEIYKTDKKINSIYFLLLLLYNNRQNISGKNHVNSTQYRFLANATTHGDNKNVK